jgi:hypothetical protein
VVVPNPERESVDLATLDFAAVELLPEKENRIADAIAKYHSSHGYLAQHKPYRKHYSLAMATQ